MMQNEAPGLSGAPHVAQVSPAAMLTGVMAERLAPHVVQNEEPGLMAAPHVGHVGPMSNPSQ